HIAFDEVCKKANERGVRVTGSELVGLIPLKSLLDAGRYFLEKQQRSVGVSEKELIHIAVKSLGLDELSEFIPEKKIIEYLLNEEKQDKLVNLSLQAFANETASESPAPGGGSIAAYMGSLGISLATMVANLSAHKRGWDQRWKEFSAWAEKGQKIKDELLYLVDEDTNAFNKIMEAFSLPKSSEQEVKTRSEAIQNATKYATEVPLKTMILAYSSFPIIKAMAEIGNPNSISDAGVGVLCARSAVIGAYMNVRINAAELKDEVFKKEILAKAEKIKNDAIKEEEAILKIVYAVI
ncbi:MAG: glutamate formimidoyltransferase, partial [Flavobacteriia bacterium]|nr:glutamate formimidoyltransferase [Flavobacteriia bacterium]